MKKERDPDPVVRRTQRVLLMVHELHKLGYQRIRVSPGMSSSGMHWRCAITPTSNILSTHGAMIANEGGQVARYTSAQKNEYFEWQDARRDTARELAAKFIERFPELAREGRGRDWAYAGWYAEMLGLAERGIFPIAYGDTIPEDPEWLYTSKGLHLLPMPPPGEGEPQEVMEEDSNEGNPKHGEQLSMWDDKNNPTVKPESKPKASSKMKVHLFAWLDKKKIKKAKEEAAAAAHSELITDLGLIEEQKKLAGATEDGAVIEQQHFEEFGLENVHAPNYLGSPAVVAKIVQDYFDKLYDLIKKVRTKDVSKEDFKADWMQWAKEFSDIFMGRNPDYIKIAGWHSPYALGMSIKQVIPQMWEKDKAEYHNDPGQVLFGYMGAMLMDSMHKAMKDPDGAGMEFNDNKQRLIRLLLGLEWQKRKAQEKA